MNKRTFLRHSLSWTLGTATYPLLNDILKYKKDVEASVLAKDEEFWAEIRAGYRLKPDYINLENGYYCICPQETLDNLIQHVEEINYQGSYYMRTVQWQNKNQVAKLLSELAGCEPDELIITRNTTESLDTIIGGFPWQEGDEAIMAEQDYGAMRNMFNQVSRRYGMINKIISVPLHPKSDEEIVDLYASAITSKTKLLMVCHMINITGHILPIRKICDMAHERGVEVMVDGAHSFAHIDFSIKDLHCDYYGTSLHKWLSTPLGAGFLYVNREKIPKIWPRFAEEEVDENNIRRLNHTGTHPVHTDLAIINAIDYHNRIGINRKEERLRFLQKYWSDQVRDVNGIMVNTPVEPQRCAGIANVGIKGMKPAEMAELLLKEYRIWTVAIDGAGVHGCRISPNIYTNTKELDEFVEALKKMVI